MFIIKFPRHQSKLLSKIANANYSGAYVTTHLDIELLYLTKSNLNIQTMNMDEAKKRQ